MNQKKFGLTSFSLHLIAMAIMLCDHMWATVVPGNMWMTNLGRLAFPIFAFMLVEGFFRTKNLKAYMRRMLIGALISEIPFNLMLGGSIIYPFHQNVMWTFLIALCCMAATEREKGRWKIPAGIGIFCLGAFLGFITMVDYQGFGILTVGVFYAFRGDEWWKKLLQIAGLYVVHVTLFAGMMIDVTLFGHTFEIQQQGLAIFAMLPILLYNKEQGPHNKGIQYAFYLFYPVHMLLLAMLALYA